MKALSRSLSIDIELYTELALLLTQLLYLVIISLNPFYCYMLFSVCLYKPLNNIITVVTSEFNHHTKWKIFQLYKWTVIKNFLSKKEKNIHALCWIYIELFFFTGKLNLH